MNIDPIGSSSQSYLYFNYYNNPFSLHDDFNDFDNDFYNSNNIVPDIKYIRKVFNFLEKKFNEIDFDEDCPARVVACLIIKKKMVFFGHNMKKSNPYQAKFGKNTKSIFFHAETNALKKALLNVDKNDLIKYKKTLFILRLKSRATTPHKKIWGMAKPCPGCMRAIIDFPGGIKNIIYSLDNNSNDDNQKKFEILTLRQN